MKKEKIEISFELAEVSNKFLLHLKDTTDFVTQIYYALENCEIDINKPLPTDSFPLLINDNKPKKIINEQKRLALQWIITKAFEDIIIGLTKKFQRSL